jgi:hypothetical protein
MPVYVVKRRRHRDWDVVPMKAKYKEHCERRFAERTDIPHYSKRMRTEILSSIREGRGVFVKKTTNSRTVWKNVVPGHPEVYVVYSNTTKEIVTMYVPDAS